MFLFFFFSSEWFSLSHDHDWLLGGSFELRQSIDLSISQKSIESPCARRLPSFFKYFWNEQIHGRICFPVSFLLPFYYTLVEPPTTPFPLPHLLGMSWHCREVSLFFQVFPPTPTRCLIHSRVVDNHYFSFLHLLLFVLRLVIVRLFSCYIFFFFYIFLHSTFLQRVFHALFTLCTFC